MERLGVFAKIGAEGVMVMTAPNGTTSRSRCSTARRGPRRSIALRLLADAGAVEHDAVDTVQTELDLWVMGGERRVGQVRASF